MKKLIISKELANDVKHFRENVTKGIKEIVFNHGVELIDLGADNAFLSAHQVASYLLGGQERVYEVKKQPWSVVWLTGLEKFYAFKGDKSDELISAYEVTIKVYDTEKEAKRQVERLNHTLNVIN